MKNKVLLLIAVVTLGLTATTLAQVPSYVPSNGLVGWWPFNGNANDESGNGNNGTVNGATLTTDRNGNANQAYSFDGLNDYISATPTLPTGSAPRTVCCWFKTIAGSIPTSQYPYVQTMTGWGSSFPGTVIFPQHVVAPSGKAYFESGSSGNQLFSQNAVNDGIWHQIVTTYDGNNSRVKMYIDAMLQDSSIVISLGTAASFFGIGNVSWANIPFQGQIDDVGLWDRALNQQEITTLYNGCQLAVNAQPANQTININNNAQFIVGSSDPNATYQWQTDLGLGFQNVSNAGQYSGSSNDTLSVSNVSMSNNNQLFRCIINSGSCADTSNVAVLTINNNVGIHEMAQHNLFSVFPNPAHNVINVKADHKLIGSVFTIYDNTGKAVQSGKINAANTSIELSNLSTGFYMFSLGENRKQSFKIIKE
jgi:hypothetical protein